MSKTKDVIDYLVSLTPKCNHKYQKLCECKYHKGLPLLHDRSCCFMCIECKNGFNCDHKDKEECKCTCHEHPGALHIMPCCESCTNCGFKIKL